MQDDAIWTAWVEDGTPIDPIHARTAGAAILAHIAGMSPSERVTAMTRNRDFAAVCGIAVVTRDGAARDIETTFKTMRLNIRRAFDTARRAAGN